MVEGSHERGSSKSELKEEWWEKGEKGKNGIDNRGSLKR